MIGGALFFSGANSTDTTQSLQMTYLVIAALVGAGGLGMVLMPRNKVSQIGTAIPAAAAGGKA